MLDHLLDTDVICDVANLYETSASRDIVSRMATLCASDEKSANTITFCSDLPTWIHRRILIYDRVWNERDSFQDLGNIDFSLEFQSI